MTNDGHVTLDDEGLFRLHDIGHAVLRIPGGANKHQVRLMCAHMKEADHRGAVATLQRLPEYSCLVSHGSARHRVHQTVCPLYVL